jgi:hypothetical protein
MTKTNYRIFRTIKTSTGRWLLTKGEKILKDYSRRRDVVRGFHRMYDNNPANMKLIDNKTKEVLSICTF